MSRPERWLIRLGYSWFSPVPPYNAEIVLRFVKTVPLGILYSLTSRHNLGRYGV
jgi:hypothetical protein